MSQKLGRTKYLVYEIEGKGFGLFSLESYKEEELVFDESKHIFIHKSEFVFENSMKLYGNYYIDSHTTLISDFINHSCDPNLRYDIENFKFNAVKNIKVGEELTYNYNMTEVELEREKLSFICCCNSQNCVGVVRSKLFCQ